MTTSQGLPPVDQNAPIGKPHNPSIPPYTPGNQPSSGGGGGGSGGHTNNPTPNPNVPIGIPHPANTPPYTTSYQPGGNSNISQEISINPNNIITSQIAGINQVAIQGTAANNLLRKAQVEIAIDQNAVNQYNQANANIGINNAQDYFNAIRNPQAQTQAQTTTQPYNQIPLLNQSYTPERTISPQETQPHITNIEYLNPFPQNQKYGGEIHANNPAEENITRPWTVQAYNAFETGWINLQQKSQQPGEVILPLAIIPLSYLYGRAEGAIEAGKGISQLANEAPKGLQALNPINDILFLGKTAVNLIEGTAAESNKIINLVIEGNVPNIIEEAGKIQTQTEIAHEITSPFKSAFVDFGKELKYEEATQAPKEAYTFELPNPEQKNTYQVPPEYTETLGNIPKVTQPTTPTTLEVNQNTPSYWLELSKELPLKNELNNKIPELQSKLNIEITPPENGATTLTPQEILELNKQTNQANLIEFFNKKGQSQNLIIEIPRAIEDIQAKYKAYRANQINREGIIELTGSQGEIPIYLFHTDFDTSLQSNNIPITGLEINQPSAISHLVKANIAHQQIQSQSNSLIQGQSLGQEQTTTQAQTLTQIPLTTTIQEQNTNILETPRTIQTTTSFNPEIFKTPNKNEEKKKQNKKQQITAQVRKRGKFQNIGIFENQNQAETAAEKNVLETASASLRLLNENNEPIQINPGQKFYASKKERGVYIQKNPFRISSSGEKAEITQRGIMTQRLKTKNKGIF